MTKDMEWNTYEELVEMIEEDTGKILGSDALYDRIKDNLDYKIEYAEDRAKQLNDCMDMKVYVDCLSSKPHSKQQEKTKNSPLAEDDGYSKHLNSLADYINFSSYDNLEDRVRTENLKEEMRELKKIKDKDAREKKRYMNRDTQKSRPGLLSNSRPTRARVRIHNIEGFLKDENGAPTALEIHSDGYSEVVYSFNDKALVDNKFENNMGYWVHFGRHNNIEDSIDSIFNVDRTVPYWENSYDIINQMSEAMEKTKALEFKKNYNDKEKSIFRRARRELTEDYNLTVDILRDPMSPSSSIPSVTVDPMLGYEEEIDYSSRPVVKELLYGYAELKEEYGLKPHMLIWDMLIDFEQAHEKIVLSPMQETVIATILKTPNWSYNDVLSEIEKEHHKKVTKQSVNHHIDSYLNKILVCFSEETGDIQT